MEEIRNDYKRKHDLIIDLFKTVAVQKIPAPIIKNNNYSVVIHSCCHNFIEQHFGLPSD
jgi:hypothetical protein